jgi:hypothetical protein
VEREFDNEAVQQEDEEDEDEDEDESRATGILSAVVKVMSSFSFVEGLD